MKITEVRVKLMEDRRDKLQAFCSITIDDGFVIRDLKIIEGAKGAFVAMPSRKLTDRCPKCGGKNHLRANHCNDCGHRLEGDRADKDSHGRAKLHADIAHPINAGCRELVQRMVLEAFKAELERSKQPGYVAPKLDFGDEDFAEDDDAHEAAAAPAPSSSPAPATLVPTPELKPAPRSAPREAASSSASPGRGGVAGTTTAPERSRTAVSSAAPPQAETKAASAPRTRPARDGEEPPPDDNFASGIFG